MSSKHPTSNSGSSSSGSSAMNPSTSDTETPGEVFTMMRRPRESVFRVTHDGQFFLAPESVRGTPVHRVDASSDYNKHTWVTLESYLEREPLEELLKSNAHAELARDPNNAEKRKTYKLHSDNVSKHRKIRDVFGGQSTYHPNQFVAKRYLPSEGLCQQETMYLLACKISDMQQLHLLGELAMDPFDFLRWRCGRALEASIRENLDNIPSKIRSIIHNIFGADSVDQLLRGAVLRSAFHQGTDKRFGTKKRTATETSTADMKSRVQKSRPSAPNRRNTTVQAALVANAASRERPRRPARPSEYQGVNAFRAQQKQHPAQPRSDF
ncbi:hypothetical protein G7046_g7337 [Stylonectria norvegica]|nr:hypothetical protein G7046_g7337 [Stylonectria norvegica]